tara:strand:- start:78 stop:545 length:468 start_codon:yes stop_codon:yes gene_type:complete
MFLFLVTLIANGNDKTPMNYESYHGHDNYWKVIPEVVLCQKQSVFTYEQVEDALVLWKKKYSKITVSNDCSYDQERGKIKIVDGKYLKPRQWGYTSFIYSKRVENGKSVKAYSSAIVQLDKRVRNTNILVHELGHAFGIDHYDKTYDIMNSYATY